MGYNHEEYQREVLTKMGLDFDKLTDEQKYMALEPMDAPENYHCDGEISNREADMRWGVRLKEVGFSTLQVYNIKRHIG